MYVSFILNKFEVFLFIASSLQTVFFTLPLTSSPTLVFAKTIDSSDDGESFGVDVGAFSGLMKTANITMCLKSGITVTTLSSELIINFKSFYFTIPKNSIGQLFEVYALTNDPNPGSMMVSFRYGSFLSVFTNIIFLKELNI
jgi:hypothetical protein